MFNSGFVLQVNIYKEEIATVSFPRTSGLNESIIIAVCLFDVDSKVEAQQT